jgi:hypothetical protein
MTQRPSAAALIGCLLLPPLVADVYYAALLRGGGELAGEASQVVPYLLQRLVGDLSVTVLVAALLFRLSGRWALWAWPVGYSLLSWADGVVYFFSRAPLSVYHFSLASPAYILRFLGPFLAASLLACAAASLLFLLAVRRLAAAATFARLAAPGLLFGVVAAVNLPWWTVERPNLQESTPAALARQGASQRLRQLSRLPAALAVDALTPRHWAVRPTRDLAAASPAVAKWRLPLGAPDPAPLGGAPFRTVVLITTESLSLDLLGAYNPRLRAVLSPFYGSPLVRARMHERYYTTAAPTRQGLLVSFTSHPNPDLAQDVGGRSSFVAQLGRAGFRTTYIKGDSRHDSPEAYLLAQLGFDEILASEELRDDAAAAAHARGTGVADAYVYEALLSRLARQGTGRHFYALLGVDTHPGAREIYDDLPYPDVSALLPPGSRHAVLRDVAWHDLDIARLWERLQHSPAFGDDFLLILTADHCRPYSLDVAEIPGYPKDSACRIPFALLTPRSLPPMAQRAGSQLDLAPTVMHLVGGSRLAGWWGRSLLDPHSDNPALSLMDRSLVIRSGPDAPHTVALDAPRDDAERALAELVDTLYLDP